MDAQHETCGTCGRLLGSDAEYMSTDVLTGERSDSRCWSAIRQEPCDRERRFTRFSDAELIALGNALAARDWALHDLAYALYHEVMSEGRRRDYAERASARG